MVHHPQRAQEAVRGRIMVRATNFESEVREPRDAALSSRAPDETSSLLAHPSDRLLIQLNPDWRVVDDDLQYILQHTKGTPRSKATGWVGRSFCRSRSVLVRSIRKNCGVIDEGAFAQVEALPEWHMDR